MDAFTDADRDRAIASLSLTQNVIARMETLERGQRMMLRRQRRVPTAVGKHIAEAISKKAALLIAVGIVIGSALGGAAMELARQLILSVFPGRVP